VSKVEGKQEGHAPGISVVMTAFNEHAVIEGCLESVAGWADEMVVADGSTDPRTAEIASRFTDRVLAVENDLMIGANKNAAIDAAGHEWVLVIDPDERVSPELATELVEYARGDLPHDGYWIPVRTEFLGVRLRPFDSHAGYQLRFFRNGRGRYPCRALHEKIEVGGTTGRSHGELIHRPPHGLAKLVWKQNLYSEHHALAAKRRGERFRLHRLLLGPPYAFVRRFILQSGWRHGILGFMLSVQVAYSVFLIEAKLWELERSPDARPGDPDRTEWATGAVRTGGGDSLPAAASKVEGTQDGHAPGISVVMSAFNEHAVIEECLESVAGWADEIVVADGSTDPRTGEIVRRFTERVLTVRNDLMLNVNKNAAIDAARHEWVLVIDPDERVSPELAAELVEHARSDPPHDGYWIPRGTEFLGVRLPPFDSKNAGYMLRFLRKGRGRFPCRTIHEGLEVRGTTGRTRGDLIHRPPYGLAKLVWKQNLFSEHHALAAHRRGERFRLHRLLLAPPYAFVRRFILQSGWRYGILGLMLSVQVAYSAFLIEAKLWELERSPDARPGDPDRTEWAAAAGVAPPARGEPRPATDGASYSPARAPLRKPG
jgi:(heptosyl)LPS beta-1,4-glucosyltransferase